MRGFLGVLCLSLAFSQTLSISDRRCGSDVTKMWLDVVIIVDNSKIASNYNVYETILSLFPRTLQIGTGYDDPRSTRVGIITYNYNATDVADFYKLQSWDQLQSQLQALRMTPLSSSSASRMDTALVAAMQMINSTAGFRDNYKKIVIVFTNVHGTYKSNPPKDVAKSLNMKGIPVITVNTGSSSDVSAWLKNIASDNMAFALADGNVTQEIQKAMTDTNCYCQTHWLQYNWPWNNFSNKYGTCVLSPVFGTVGVVATRDSAKQYCHQNYPNSYLVNELDQQKRSFNFAYLNAINSSPVNAFYNGLFNLNGVWLWDQPDNQPPIALNPNSGAPPARASCVADMKYSDGTTAWTPVSCGNSFHFICEKVACDTDNYCEYA